MLVSPDSTSAASNSSSMSPPGSATWRLVLHSLPLAIAFDQFLVKISSADALTPALSDDFESEPGR